MSIDNKKYPTIPLLVPSMPEAENLFKYIKKIDASKQYTNFGPLVNDLEKKFSEIFKIEKSCLTTVSSATSGLELVLQSLNLPKGASVLVPAFTFVATATSVIRAGYSPVFSDVDIDSWVLTPEIARQFIQSKKVDAIIPVATFGVPLSMKAWSDFEMETGIPVVIDAAAAFGSQLLNGEKGTVVFSLHATKCLPAGEGGLVVSTRPGLAAKVRELSNFGINLTKGNKYKIGELSGFGTNAKMSEYHAAVCLASLENWEVLSKKRRETKREYKNKIDTASSQLVAWQKEDEAGRLMAPTVLCVKLPNSDLRQKLEKICAKRGVATRRWYQPLLNDMALMQEDFDCIAAPNCQELSATIIGIPFFVDISEEEMLRVASCFAYLK